MRGVMVCGSLLLRLGACGSSDGVAPDAPLPTVDAAVDSVAAGISVTPASHGFGSVEIGAGSPALALVVSTGITTGPVAVSVTGPNASEVVRIGDTCSGTSLTPQATCTLYVALQPSGLGPKSAQVEFSASPGGTVSAAITATAVIPAQRQTIAPATFAFATVPAGGFSLAAKRFTVTNTGSAAVGPMTPVVTGSDAAAFEIDSTHDTCTNQINAPGASCTVDVLFTPSTVGMKSASVAIFPLATTTVATLSGTAAEPPLLSISPTPKDFGAVFVGTASTSATFTVRNDGLGSSEPLAVAKGWLAPEAFAIVADSCTGVALAPSQSCSVLVQFRPTDLGERKASLEVTSFPFTSLGLMSGTGIMTDGAILLPTSFDFGPVRVGSMAQRTFTLSNNGSSATGGLAVSVTGPDANQFQITAGGDECSGVALAPGDECTVRLQFAPTSTGAKTVVLQAFAAPGGMITSLVTGRGEVPVLQMTPSMRDFGSVTVATESSTQRFTVTNTGGAQAQLSTAVTGPAANEFANFIQENLCAGTSLAPAASCTIDIRCAPTTPGPKLATLVVASGTLSRAESTLSCTGVASEGIAASPTLLTFSGVAVGTTSAIQTVVVTNHGSQSAIVTAPTLMGTSAAEYQLDLVSTCVGGTVLPPGANCTVAVRLLPTSAGAKLATILVTSTLGTVSIALDGSAS